MQLAQEQEEEEEDRPLPSNLNLPQLEEVPRPHNNQLHHLQEILVEVPRLRNNRNRLRYSQLHHLPAVMVEVHLRSAAVPLLLSSRSHQQFNQLHHRQEALAVVPRLLSNLNLHRANRVRRNLLLQVEDTELAEEEQEQDRPLHSNRNLPRLEEVLLLHNNQLHHLQEMHLEGRRQHSNRNRRQYNQLHHLL
jgi:hypothetical protein